MKAIWSWRMSWSAAHGDRIAIEKDGHTVTYLGSMLETEAESIVAALNGTSLIPQCKNCRHWSKEIREDAFPDEYNGTEPLLKWRHRACLQVIDTVYWAQDEPLSDEGKVNLQDDIAFLDVYEAFENELMTGPEFGCVRFERILDKKSGSG